MLSERLKELEAEGIVDRLVRAEKPVRVEYLLTRKGRALADVVEAVSGWAEAWATLGVEGIALAAGDSTRTRGREQPSDPGAPRVLARD